MKRPALAHTVALTLALGLTATASEAVAWELAGDKVLTAHTRDAGPLRLGTVRFEPQADGSVRYTLAFDAARFTDHFLSMKEFKCFGGADELMCHVPYPYAQPGTVRADDLAWLEHALLFLYKRPGEFGAKLWNGLYFRLARGEAGLVGTPQAIDLNRISAPPERPAEPPYRAALRDDIAAGARWVERLTIE